MKLETLCADLNKLEVLRKRRSPVGADFAPIGNGGREAVRNRSCVRERLGKSCINSGRPLGEYMPRARIDHRAKQSPAALQTTKGVISKVAAERATQAGIDTAPFLREANLTPDLVKDAEIRIAVRAQVELLDQIADALQDKWLGFHLARDVDLREFGSFYYLMTSSQKLGDAFECAARYSQVVNDGLKISRGSRMLSLDFEYVGIERHADVHQIEFWMTYILRLSRVMTGRELVPSTVNFLHHREGDTTEMQRYYGCALKFGMARDCIVFDPVESELPNVTADPFLHRFLLEYYDDAAARRHSRQSSLRTRVENAITSRLSNGTAIIGNIASDLGMSSRTLSRRLAEEGSTFSSILDELRSSLAGRYLQDSELSISQIAWLLGYTEVSSFAHAFQRWTGRSPTSARRQITDMDELVGKHSTGPG